MMASMCPKVVIAEDFSEFLAKPSCNYRIGSKKYAEVLLDR